MKKTILLLLTCILCAAFFTGCPHETPVYSEPEQNKYPREIIFDKETFDTQRKAWKESGIKKYRFSQIFIWEGKGLLCRITVEDNVETAREFFWGTYDHPETFENYVTIVDLNIDEDLEYELLHQPNYIDYTFIIGKDTVPVTSVDDIFSQINEWYEEACSKDFIAEKIAEYRINVNYMADFSVPVEFSNSIITESLYDNFYSSNNNFEIQNNNSNRVYFGMQFYHYGWQDKIFDFEILDD